MNIINERFNLILKEKYAGNVSEFARKSGIPQPTLNNIVGNRLSKPSFDSIEKLINSDETINPEWIITGKGQMVKEQDMLRVHHPPYPEPINENVVVPLYNIEAAANLNIIMEKCEENAVGYLSLPNMPAVDGAVTVRGDKMISLTIPPEAKPIIKEWIGRNGKLNFGYDYTYENFRNYVTKQISRLAKKLGIDRRVVYYSARKSLVQHGFELGVNLEVLEYTIGQSMKKNRPIFNYVRIMRSHADKAIRSILDNLKEKPKKKAKENEKKKKKDG